MSRRRLDNKYAEMYEQYQKGYSMYQVGKTYGMSRQGVYGGFKKRNYKLRSKKRLPFQTFNGVKYSLRNHGYYSQTNGKRSLMHRDVWEYHNGKIAKGFDIHHKNHDKADNRIENLELYSKSKHAKKFNTGSNQYAKKTLQKTNQDD